MQFNEQLDWHGCPAVRFDPEKLGGKATVLDLRMSADSVLANFDGGLTAEEIADDFQLDLEAVRTIIAFASQKRLRIVV